MGQEKDKLEVVSIRLVRDAPILSEHKICTPEDAVAVLGELMCDLDREVICVVNLRADGTPINCHFASMGSICNTIASPRELFKSSILSNAASMILLHNHPGGNLTPSKEDTIVTDTMIKLCTLMDIPLMDHIIIGGDNSNYFSFRQKKLLSAMQLSVCADYRTLDFPPDMPRTAERSR